LSVLRQTFALAAPSGAFAVSISLLSVKRERSPVDRGSSVALAGCSPAETAAAALAEVRPCASDVLLTTDCDDGAALDDGFSSLATSVPLH